MPTVTSRRAKPDAKILADRRKLADERYALEKKLAGDNAKIDAIETRLKTIATEAGDGFREPFPDGGYVDAQPGHAAEFKGNVPVIQTEAWLALPPAERKKLEKSGLVAIEPQWGKRSNGRVTVKLAKAKGKAA